MPLKVVICPIVSGLNIVWLWWLVHFSFETRGVRTRTADKKKRNREPKSPTPELLRLLAAAAKKIYTIKTKSFLFEAAARRALFGVFFF